MELTGHLAVVLSLIYVGVQVRQNTVAVQTDTSQTIYDYHREVEQIVAESEELAELELRTRTAPWTLSPVDTVRAGRLTNLRINLYESVYTSAQLGSVEMEMAGGWLRGLPLMACDEFNWSWWTAARDEYHPDFAAAMDSARSEFCPGT
jgi:hypothetical protein